MGTSRSEVEDATSPDDDSRPDTDVRPDRTRRPGLDRFEVLFATTIVNVVVLGLVDLQEGLRSVESITAMLVVTISAGTTIVLAYRAAGASRRRQRFALLYAVVAVVLTLFLLIAQSVFGVAPTREVTITPTVWLGLSFVATLVVVRRLLQHRRVGMQTLYGALAAYMLIGVTFCFAFQVIAAVEQVPFFGTETPTTSYMYFSLVTLTTVGYGGLEAATPLGQLVSSFEALVGQVYLVTIVAMIVGLLAQRRE